VGAGVGVVARAAAIAVICAVVSVENCFMPLTLLMPAWIWLTVAPLLELEASGPWQDWQ
jgi:hypothetical protein